MHIFCQLYQTLNSQDIQNQDIQTQFKVKHPKIVFDLEKSDLSL